MKLNNVFFLICSTVLFCVAEISSAAAQKDSLSVIFGRALSVVYPFTPVPHANVVLTASDSTKFYGSTSKSGDFKFNDLPAGEYHLLVTSLGFIDYNLNLSLGGGQNIVFANMVPQEESIGESVIVAKQPFMKQRGDTLVYNANALKTKDGDDAAALLMQIPGVTFRGGKLKVHGKEVNRTYVNGVQIFGNNPMSAFKNLLASDVTEIKVYDELSAEDERKKRQNADKQRVLDITTKEKIISAIRLRVAVAGGADGALNANGDVQGRYHGSYQSGFFSEMFLLNSTGRLDNMGGLEPLGYGSSAELAKPLNGTGITGDFSASVNKYWKDRRYGNNIFAEYRYGVNEDNTFTSSKTEYYDLAESPARMSADTSYSINKRNAHTIILDAILKDTPLKSISIKNRFSFENRDNSSISSSILENALTSEKSNEQKSDKSKNFEYSGSVFWTNNDAQKLIPSVKAEFNIANNSDYDLILDTLPSTNNKRYLQGTLRGKRIDGAIVGKLEYLLENSRQKTQTLNARYGLNTFNRSKDKLVLDYLNDPAVPQVFTPGTYKYTWNQLDNYLGLAYGYQSKKYLASVFLNIACKTQNDNKALPDAYNRKYTFWSVCPSLDFTYNRVLDINLKTGTTIPSVEQLRNQINFSNKMFLSGGNPNLLQEYSVDLDFRYHPEAYKNGGSLEVAANVKSIFNPISTKSIYFTKETVLPEWNDYVAPAYSTLTTYTNATPFVSANASAKYDGRIQKLRINYSAGTDFSFSNGPQYLHETEYRQSVYSPGISFVAKYNGSNISARLSVSSHYNYSNSNINATANRYFRNSVSFNIFPVLSKHISLIADYTYSGYSILSGMWQNSNFHRLNFSFVTRFLKNSLYIKLNALDILNGISSYSINAYADRMEEYCQPAYGRYFTVSVQYKFSKNK